MNKAGDDARDKPTIVMENDLSENDSNFWDDRGSPKDDVICATVSNDGDCEEGDDDSSGESENSDNDLASQSFLMKTKKWLCDHKLH